MKQFSLLLQKGITIVFFLAGPLLLRAQPPIITYQSAITGLSAPVDLVNAGDGSNRLFIVQQTGIIRVWNGTTLSEFANFGSTGANIITSGGEQGLLSMAFHPDFDGVTNRYFFIYYNDLNGDIAVRRYQTTAGNSNTADLSTSTPIITIPHPVNSNHNGGKLNFGPDGYLYFATGDGGGGNDVPNNAQTGTVLLGKMLRLNIDTSTVAYGNYGIPTKPTGNPYVEDAGIDDRIWALGLRNPFRWSFDRLTGDMWIGDVGQGAFEEINYRPANATGHVNYGWRCYEGYASTPGVPDCIPVDYVPPVYDYPNPGSGSSSVIGGFVYRGNEYPNFRGYYIATDVYSDDIFLLWPNGSGGFDSSVQTGGAGYFVVGIGEAEDGTLYAVSQGTNTVYKIVATGGTVLPVKLGNFSVTPSNGYNRINWTTLSETNAKNFHVEYGNNGRDFERVGTVNSRGMINGSSYRYDHRVQSKQDMYYRLAMEDFNGTVQYSTVQRVPGTRESGMRLYPTVVQQLSFTLESLYDPVHLIRVFHSGGRQVFSQNLNGFTGEKLVTLPSLAKGVYVVEILGKTQSQMQKIIIQ